MKEMCVQGEVMNVVIVVQGRIQRQRNGSVAEHRVATRRWLANLKFGLQMIMNSSILSVDQKCLLCYHEVRHPLKVLERQTQSLERTD